MTDQKNAIESGNATGRAASGSPLSNINKPNIPATGPSLAQVQEIQSKNAPPTFKEEAAATAINECKDCTCEKGCDDECRKEIKEYSEGKAPAKPPHTSKDIANATIAVFGEMSPAGKSPDKEAKAIASCLFNRVDDVKSARDNNEKLLNDPELSKQLANVKAEIAELEKRGKSLRSDAEVKENREKWREKIKEKERLEGRRNVATADANRLSNQYLGSKDADANLTNVAKSGKNFGGHGKGMEYVAEILSCKAVRTQKVNGKAVKAPVTLSCADLKSYCRRWRAAKKAVADIADKKASRDPYRYMFSNNNGTREKEGTDTRIDGNDFSEGPMKEQRPKQK